MENGFEESLRNHFPPDVIKEISLSLEQEPTHCLILNNQKLDVSSFQRNFPKLSPHPFVANAFYYSKEDYDFGKSITHASGGAYIQDAAAMMPAFLLEAGKGESFIDLCSAPGGKTIDACLLYDPKVIVSNDISYARAKELSGNIERMGIDSAMVCSVEPRMLVDKYGPIFDNVILDAPCSGSAMFRKNELAKEDWSLSKVLRCAKVQQSLLEDAYGLLRPGGTLIYSTCSFSKEENENNIALFLNNHLDMVLIPLPQHEQFYRPTEMEEAIYLLPSRFPGEGQFVAKLRKKGEKAPLYFASKKAKISKNNQKLQLFLEKYGFSSWVLHSSAEAYYCFPSDFPVPPGYLRIGVKLCEKEKLDVPDHALSHALPNFHSLPLDKEKAISFLWGETFPLKGENGFHIVSYQGLNLGWVKIVNGIAKNHYPKGLRQRFNLDY